MNSIGAIMLVGGLAAAVHVASAQAAPMGGAGLTETEGPVLRVHGFHCEPEWGSLRVAPPLGCLSARLPPLPSRSRLLVGQAVSPQIVGEAVLAALAANAIGRLALAASAGPIAYWVPLAAATALAAGCGLAAYLLIPSF